MGLTGVTHLLTCSLGASWRGLAQGPLRVPYMGHGCSISMLLAYFSPQAPSRRARSPASVRERPQLAGSQKVYSAREKRLMAASSRRRCQAAERAVRQHACGATGGRTPARCSPGRAAGARLHRRRSPLSHGVSTRAALLMLMFGARPLATQPLGALATADSCGANATSEEGSPTFTPP